MTYQVIPLLPTDLDCKQLSGIEGGPAQSICPKLQSVFGKELVVKINLFKLNLKCDLRKKQVGEIKTLFPPGRGCIPNLRPHSSGVQLW